MRLIVLFIGLALMATAFLVTRHFMPAEPEKEVAVIAKPQVIVKEVPTIDIYTAKQDIPIGTEIAQDMLDIQPWPKHLKLQDMVEADPTRGSDLVKMVARTPFQKGEPIILSKLANDKDPSFLAASLPKGMRAVTIAVDSVSGVGGFVFPGDRIDVLITHDVPTGQVESSGSSASNPVAATGAATSNNIASGESTMSSGSSSTTAKKAPVTEVLLSNIRVMAVNQHSTAHGGDAPIVPTSVSLEVTASDAQKLGLASNGNGRLSLALRSLKDLKDTDMSHPTTLGDLAHPEGTEENSRSSGITVVRGTHSEAIEVTRP